MPQKRARKATQFLRPVSFDGKVYGQVDAWRISQFAREAPRDGPSNNLAICVVSRPADAIHQLTLSGWEFRWEFCEQFHFRFRRFWFESFRHSGYIITKFTHGVRRMIFDFIFSV